MQRFLILFLLTTACLGAQGQQLDPNDYIYPLRELKQRLYSANFGEIRPGHFHAGVDIKTDAEEGKPVVAAADGYVSRVVLQAGGYGRAVYLTLRNGTTVVYGHLRRFRDDIERHVRRERYERRSNGVNLWFGPGTWPVKQGDVVAYSGDSGSSGGPHLHYEIRDTETQRLYNPVREGIIRPRDEYPPRIVRLHYVEVDTVQGVPVRSVPESYAVIRTAAGRYALTHDGPVGVGRRGYFVAEVTDRRNDVWNTFGVWRVTAFADGIPCFEFRMDSFTYDISRCSDAVSCYPIQINSRNEAIRLAQLEGAPGRDAAARPDFGPARRTRGGGPHSRRDDLRADLRPSRTRRGPAGGFGRRRALARLPFLRPRDAPFPRRGGHAPRQRAAPAATTRPTGRTHAQRLAGLRRRRICRRRGDGFGADGRRPGDRSRHAAARDPSALRRRRRPHPGRRGAVPRRGQLLGHRLVEAAHRRQMGSLRPFSDERNAGSFLRRAGAAAHPRRASFGHRRMRKRNAFRRNILPLTNDGFGKNFLYLRELQRNTQ